MTVWTYRAIIVPDAQVTYARDLSAAVAGPAGGGMYTTPLSATGAEPATHWISAGIISDGFAALLPLTTYQADAEPVHTPGNAAQVVELANAAGYTTTETQVQELFDASEVTDEDAQEEISKRSLMFVVNNF